MKALKVRDKDGWLIRGWYFGTFRDYWQVGVFEASKDTNEKNLRIRETSRKISGWKIVSHDGIIRLNEGNWQQFVPFARLIVSNYGYTVNIS